MIHLRDFHYLDKLVNILLDGHVYWKGGLENNPRKNSVEKLNRSSFHRYIKYLANILGVNIAYSSGYTVTNSNSIKSYNKGKSVLDNNGTIQWLTNTIAVSDTFLEYLPLQNQVLLESVPQNNGCIRQAVNAMRDSYKLLLHHKRYDSNVTTTEIVEPYCIKLYNRRWYLLAHFSKHEKDYYTIYAFDRIEKIQILHKKFIMPADFSAEDHFKFYYGVYLKDIITDKIPVIKFRVFGKKERSYIEDLKIHESQRVIYSDEANNFSDYEINVQPTDDLIACFLSHKNNVQILEPEYLRTRLIEKVNKAIKHYK